MKVEGPFVDEILGLAIIKVLDNIYTKHNDDEIKIHTKFSHISHNR